MELQDGVDKEMWDNCPFKASMNREGIVDKVGRSSFQELLDGEMMTYMRKMWLIGWGFTEITIEEDGVHAYMPLEEIDRGLWTKNYPGVNPGIVDYIGDGREPLDEEGRPLEEDDEWGDEGGELYE